MLRHSVGFAITVIKKGYPLFVGAPCFYGGRSESAIRLLHFSAAVY